MTIQRRTLFLRELLTTLFRQQRLARYLFFGIVGATFVGNYLLPSVYESRATLLVATSAPDEDLGEARTAAVQLLQDADFLEIAVTQIGAVRLLERNTGGWAGLLARAESAVRTAGETLFLVPRLDEVERAVRLLRHRMTAEAAPDEHLIRVSLRDTDRDFAQAALGDLTTAFVDLHRRPRGEAAPGTASDAALTAAEAALDAFLAQHDPETLATDFERLQGEVDQLRATARQEPTPTNIEAVSTAQTTLERTRTLLEELDQLENNLLALESATALHTDVPAASMRGGPVTFSIVTPATGGHAPIAPQRMRNLTWAFWIGLFVAFIGSFVAEWVDHTILFPEDLVHRLGLPMLGSLFADEPPDERRIRMQQLCGRMRNTPGEPPPRMWLVTSVSPHEGASAFAAAVASTMAEDPTARVLHLDLHEAGDEARGFVDTILDRASLDDVLNQGDRENLWSLARGGNEVRTPLVLTADVARPHLAAIRERFTDVVVSVPPILVASEAIAVARHCDAVMLVVRAEAVRLEVIARGREVLEGAGACIGGAVLTNRHPYIPTILYEHI